MKCDICGSLNNKIVDYLHKDYPVKDKIITYTSKRRVCNKCGALIYDRELDNNSSFEAFRVYNELYGIPKEDIINLRKQYKLTQYEFSKIIGCAKKTLISYEQGKSIPNDIYMITMKTLLDNPEVIALLIESNKERFDYSEYNKLQEKLEEYYQEEELSDYNGYADFYYEKIKYLIIELSKNGILKTKLLKELFYIDFLYYKNNGVGLTGMRYLKYSFGPVPELFEKLLESLVSDNVIDYKILFKNNYECHEIKSLNNKIKLQDFFKTEEIDIINKVIDFFKDFSSSDIVNYSHKEKAFIETEYNKYISYDYAFDINLD